MVLYFLRHRRNSTAPTRISAGRDLARYPKLPDMAPGRFTGRTADPGVDMQHAVIHTAPVRKPRGRVVLAIG